MTDPATPQRPAPARPSGTVKLWLDAPSGEGAKAAAHDVSAAALIGDTLFVAADEHASLEALDRQPDGSFAGHRPISLAKLFDLQDPADEMDVEGLAIEDGWLWVVGSHSRTRKKPKKGREPDAAAFEALAKLKANPNRFFLGRLPLIRLSGARWGVAGVDGADPDGRAPAMLPIGKHGDALADLLRDDPHLSPFMALPAKENGLDIEGIAVDAQRVAVGLRGPVINGWAAVLEFDVKLGKSGALKLKAGVVKRWLDLDGLGIRDLKRDGDDLLVLAGPTMALDGPAVVYRWRGWVDYPEAPEAALIRPEPMLELPCGWRCDHPEAIAPWAGVHGPRVLIVCDSPADWRLEGGGIAADVFSLPASGTLS